MLAAALLSGCLVSSSSVIDRRDGIRLAGLEEGTYCRIREAPGFPGFEAARQTRNCADFRWDDKARSYIKSGTGESDAPHRVLPLREPYYLVETPHGEGVMLLLLAAAKDAFAVHWFELREFEEVRLAAERHRVKATLAGDDIELEADNRDDLLALMQRLTGVITDNTPREVHFHESVLTDEKNGAERYQAALVRLFPRLATLDQFDQSDKSYAMDLSILQKLGDCAGCVLQGAKLPAHLQGADLRAADLTGADLTGVDLADASLGRARLSGAVLQGARLSGADLSRAILRGADLRDPGTLQADIPIKSLNAGKASVDLEMMKLKRLIDRQSHLKDLLAQGIDIRELAPEGARTTGLPRIDHTSRRDFALGHEATDASSPQVDAPVPRSTAARELPRTTLAGAVLIGADLRQARLLGADLSGATLSGADAANANFQLVDLRGARLVGTILDGVDFTHADLSGADFSMASVSGALFEPQTLPRVETTATVSGLETLRWERSQQALITLRDAFKTAGLREQERKVTYALKFWERKHTGGIEGLFNYVLFELTSDYGMSPGRPLWCILVFIFAFSIFYMFSVRDTNPRKAAIWRVWAEDRVLQEEGGSNPERVQARGVKVPLWGLYFSLLSAFHIGWRDLNVGHWIARISPHEYGLRGTGWVKVISGIQSLITVYLLALWAVTYFGRPFA